MIRCRSIVHGSIASCALGLALIVSLPAMAGDSPSNSQIRKTSRAARANNAGQHAGMPMLITVTDEAPGTSWARLRDTIANSAIQSNHLVSQTMLAETVGMRPALPAVLTKSTMDLQTVGSRVSLQFEEDYSNLLASR